MRLTPLALAALLATALPAAALADDDVDVPGISPYFCRALEGTPTGNSCTAPYVPYSGDACGVYDDVDDKNPATERWLDDNKNSCSADVVEQAKSMTLKARAKLRGYMTAGGDETRNDPVFNQSYRPNGAALDAGTQYFAAECVVKTCGGSGGDPAPPRRDSDDEDQDTAPPPPPRRQPPPYTPAPKPLVPPTFMFTVCNETNHPVLVATSDRNSITQLFTTRGWWRVNANTCLRLGPYVAGHFYFFGTYRAPGLARVYVAGAETLSLCVEPEQFNFVRGSRDACTSGQRRDFSHINTYSDFTWTIRD
ncbi:MAG TPA: DUF1036 domain-containing protein [Alphaproteobacteria bacterium]|nr:DUF1036 domain-containing protein [Alphaproteobacteria bacterium]